MEMAFKLTVLFFSVVVHEFAHGYVALLRGDTTARDAGRLTLNPVPHIDIVGTIILPLVLVISNAGVLFGWAKPVPVNPYNLRNREKDMMLVAAAGPASNIGMAVVSAILIGQIGYGNAFLSQILFYACAINVILAVFNLMPIPPLDGSKILMGLLPQDLAASYARLERYGMLIIFAALFLGLINKIIGPIYIAVLGFLLPS